VVTSVIGVFGSILQGGSKSISPSVVLSNTGGASAMVEARFADSYSGKFGLLSGTDVLPASRFTLGQSALRDDGMDQSVEVVAAGGTRSLDATLSVPSAQAPGTYTGSVILTFSNA
jgi:hypothetical protein